MTNIIYYVFIRKHHGGVTEFTGDLDDLIERAIDLGDNRVFQRVESAKEVQDMFENAEEAKHASDSYGQAYESGKGYVLTTSEGLDPEWSEKHPHADWTESDWVEAVQEKFKDEFSDASITRLPERVPIAIESLIPEITVPDLSLDGQVLANANRSSDRDNLVDDLLGEVIDANEKTIENISLDEEIDLEKKLRENIENTVEEMRNQMLSDGSLYEDDFSSDIPENPVIGPMPI